MEPPGRTLDGAGPPVLSLRAQKDRRRRNPNAPRPTTRRSSDGAAGAATPAAHAAPRQRRPRARARRAARGARHPTAAGSRPRTAPPAGHARTPTPARTPPTAARASRASGPKARPPHTRAGPARAPPPVSSPSPAFRRRSTTAKPASARSVPPPTGSGHNTPPRGATSVTPRRPLTGTSPRRAVPPIRDAAAPGPARRPGRRQGGHGQEDGAARGHDEPRPHQRTPESESAEAESPWSTPGGFHNALGAGRRRVAGARARGAATLTAGGWGWFRPQRA